MAENTFILFEKKYVLEKQQIVMLTQDDLFKAIAAQMGEGSPRGEQEDWKNTKTDAPKKPKTRLVYEFIAQVKTPAEVAKIVRGAPLKKYALFSGILQNISIEIPVMIDGIAADSLSEEWKSAEPFPELEVD